MYLSTRSFTKLAVRKASPVGSYVPDGDSHWECYGQLLSIMVLATAVEVTLDSTRYVSPELHLTQTKSHALPTSFTQSDEELSYLVFNIMCVKCFYMLLMQFWATASP